MGWVKEGQEGEGRSGGGCGVSPSHPLVRLQ